MRVVVDTNVIISRFVTPGGSVARIYDQWQQHAFELIVSEPIIAEYRRVLAYRHVRTIHGMTDDDIASVAGEIRNLAVVVAPAPLPSIVIRDDPKDDIFLACALAGAADLIVSGDRHLLRLGDFEGVPILAPAAFLALLTAEGTT
jgi:uncharacterized protein